MKDLEKMIKELEEKIQNVKDNNELNAIRVE